MEVDNSGNESPPQAGGALIDDPEYAQFCDMVRNQSKEVYDRRAWAVWDDNKICLGPLSDSEGSDVGEEVENSGGGDESSAKGLVGDHKAILRKTMDGIPGHMCIEVAGENEE